MTDMNQPFAVPTEPKKIPTGLNVLTILTFVGCAVLLLSSIWNLYNADKGLADMEKLLNSPEYDSMPAFAKKFANPEMLEMMRVQVANKYPLFAISILGCVLCFVGALQMRKLKMQGYYLYLIGQVVPWIGTAALIGVSTLLTGMGLFGLAITLLFILLYTAQRKHLINK